MTLTQHVSTGAALLILGVLTLAVMRLTRLINADTVTKKVRLYPATKLREYTLAAEEAYARGQNTQYDLDVRRRDRWATIFEFVQCPWCVGWWVALPASVVAVLVIGWPLWVAVPVALAVSHLVGVCARFADTEEITIEDAEGN